MSQAASASCLVEKSPWGAIPGIFVLPAGDESVILIAPNHAVAASDPSMWVVRRDPRPLDDDGEPDDEDLVLVALSTVLKASSAPGFRDAVLLAHRRALADANRSRRRWAARHLRSQLRLAAMSSCVAREGVSTPRFVLSASGATHREEGH